jgi:transposase
MITSKNGWMIKWFQISNPVCHRHGKCGLPRKASWKTAKSTSHWYAVCTAWPVFKLPPYTSNLIPIELAWRQIKDYIRSRITTPDMALTRLQELVQEGIKVLTNNDWTGHCNEHWNSYSRVGGSNYGGRYG